MSVKRRFAACVALGLASCSIGKPFPQATTYVVSPPIPADRIAASRRAKTLRMGNVRVAAPFAGNALVYRTDDVRFTSDPYQAFIADPGAMLGSQMAAWLDRAGPFNGVAQPGSAQPAPYVLDATVTELYGDFRAGAPPAAVMAVRFVLIDQTDASLKTVYEATISRRVDLEQATPDALVRGYGTALSEILEQLVSDLAAQG
jgi:uncharacterized lipoprotein YmbA